MTLPAEFTKALEDLADRSAMREVALREEAREIRETLRELLDAIEFWQCHASEAAKERGRAAQAQGRKVLAKYAQPLPIQPPAKIDHDPF